MGKIAVRAGPRAGATASGNHFWIWSCVLRGCSQGCGERSWPDPRGVHIGAGSRRSLTKCECSGPADTSPG
jgi:hypothetical protein